MDNPTRPDCDLEEYARSLDLTLDEFVALLDDAMAAEASRSPEA